MTDTPLHIQKKQVEIFLSKSPKERASLGFEMIQFGYEVLKQRIRSENPKYTNYQIVFEIFRQLHQKDFTKIELETIEFAFRKNSLSLQSQVF